MDKVCRCLWLTILPHSRAERHEIWKPHLLEPSGPAQGLLYLLYNALALHNMRDTDLHVTVLWQRVGRCGLCCGEMPDGQKFCLW